MNDSKEYYSNTSVAEGYDNERFTTKAGQMFDKFEKDVILNNLPKTVDGIVLDAGAGTGRFTVEIAKRGFKVYSCDQSQAMLDIIKSKSGLLNLKNQVEICKEDLTDLSFENDKFDFIGCMRVLVNLDTKKNLSYGVNELIRVCKPQGTIVFDIVNSKSVAALGPRKDSMISVKEMKEILSNNSDVKIKKCFGRRILSQKAFDVVPNLFLKPLDILDNILSRIFPSISVRVYFVLEKLG